jgi:hypothetical protein
VNRLVPLVLVLLCAALVLALGCSKPPDAASTAPTGPTKAPPTAAKAPSAPPAKTESGPKASTTESAPATPPAALSAYAWTETPTLAGIPKGTVKGALYGKPFEAKTVVMDVQKGNKLRQLVFCAREMTGNSDTLAGTEQVVITTTKDFAPGYKIEAKMGFPHDEGTIFYAVPGEKGPTSVNSPWACALQIDSGEKKPYDAKGEMVQIAGTYKGKIHLCFKDDHKSYIAGDFEAKIRYFGAP